MDTAVPKERSEHPDLDAQARLFAAAIGGAALFGIDPNEDYQRYVCYEAVRRLFDSGRAGRAAYTVISQDAKWSGTSRAPKRCKLNKALRALERAAADVMAERSSGTRAMQAHILGTVIDTHDTRGTAQVPLIASPSLLRAA